MGLLKKVRGGISSVTHNVASDITAGTRYTTRGVSNVGRGLGQLGRGIAAPVRGIRDVTNELNRQTERAKQRQRGGRR